MVIMTDYDEIIVIRSDGPCGIEFGELAMAADSCVDNGLLY